MRRDELTEARSPGGTPAARLRPAARGPPSTPGLPGPLAVLPRAARGPLEARPRRPRGARALVPSARLLVLLLRGELLLGGREGVAHRGALLHERLDARDEVRGRVVLVGLLLEQLRGREVRL